MKNKRKGTQSKKVKVLEKKIFTDHSLSFEDIEKVRGFFADNFSHEILFHNHKKDGSHRFEYPKIQYKLEADDPLIVAIGEGTKKLKEAFSGLQEIQIGNTIYPAQSIERAQDFTLEMKDELKHYYYFKSPYFALNDDNFREYKKIISNGEKQECGNMKFINKHKNNNREEQRKMLERVLTHQLLDLANGFNWRVDRYIEVQINNFDGYFKEFVRTDQKNDTQNKTNVFCFNVNFQSNMLIPNNIGIGRAKALGYGQVRRIK